MDDEDIIEPKKAQEIGSNLDDLSVDELLNYIKILKQEITRVENVIHDKSKALELAKEYFKK